MSIFLESCHELLLQGAILFAWGMKVTCLIDTHSLSTYKQNNLQIKQKPQQ